MAPHPHVLGGSRFLSTTFSFLEKMCLWVPTQELVALREELDAREARQAEARQARAATAIQAEWRGYSSSRRARRGTRSTSQAGRPKAPTEETMTGASRLGRTPAD